MGVTQVVKLLPNMHKVLCFLLSTTYLSSIYLSIIYLSIYPI
jgi:hypothetical protein